MSLRHRTLGLLLPVALLVLGGGLAAWTAGASTATAINQRTAATSDTTASVTSDPETTTTSVPDDTTTTTVPPLVRGEPIREWSLSELRGDALDEVEVDADIQVGGDLDERHDYGPTSRDVEVVGLDGSSVPPDGIATGQVASSADGVTYWVGAEAPHGVAAVPESPIGGSSELRQTQSFIKRTPDASLSITLSAASLETTDLNDLLARTCPDIHADGLRCDLIKGELFLNVEAFTVPPAPDIIPFNTFFHVAGGATLTGFAENWDSEAWSLRVSQVPLWDIEDFDFTIENIDNHREGHVLMSLRTPLTYEVDLSSVDVGQAFTLQAFASATAYNRIAADRTEFGTSVSAFLRDPLGLGGATLASSGLEPTDPSEVDRPAEEPVPPAECLADQNPDPAAGVLQFSADTYTLTEANPTPTVLVTREGGSTGAVTATFRTSDGTAIAGTDYTPVDGSVFFADGDTEPRRVEVPIVPDASGGEPDKTVNLQLSDPGGCAALGVPSSAVLTIRDDDAPPPPSPPPFGLDPTFGTGGTASITGFGGDRSAMAVQDDGQVVMVGGTFTDFVAARFDADGAPDVDFGSQGRVTTDVGGGFAQEEALGVAIQPDDRIVVAGYTNRNDVALVRYEPNGTPDGSFGTGGIVTGTLEGIANDVAIDADARIVVAGTVPQNAGDDFGDFLVARYLTDGRLDPSFGGGVGFVTTDFGNVTNEAQSLVVQADGSIVVSGSSRDPGSNGVGLDHHTDVARYLSDGTPDASFGTLGRLTLDDTLAGNDLAVRNDGALVLVGTVDTTVAPAPPGSVTELSIIRLASDGSPDGSFGTAGRVHVPVSGQRDSGNAVALQADGKIVVAGTAKNINPDFAVVRLDEAGVLDGDFGDAGIVTIDFFGFTDAAESVAVQADGRIVVGGLARDNVDGYGVARLAPLA